MMRLPAAWSWCAGSLLAALAAGCTSEPQPGNTASAGGSGSGAAPSGGGTGSAAAAGAGGASMAGSGGAAPGASGMGGSGGAVSGRAKTFVYVGTGDWGNAGAGRVRIYALDETSFALSQVGTAEAGTLPSYLTFAPAGQALYVGDEEEGVLRAFTVDRRSGSLTDLGARAASGHPVYVSVDATAGFLLAAHYEEGGIELFPIDAAGRLGAALARPSTGLQAHSAVIAPDNTAVFVPNKGSNTISQLGFDAARGVLTPSTPPSIAASGGPRHLAFHPNHDVAYVINELGSTVRAYAYVREQGVLTEIDSDDSLPAGFSGSSSGADIHVEPTGKFVYASNRAGAESTLAIFAVDPTSGALAPVGHESTRGNTPRNFAIHPAGQLLLVANQDSNQLAAFRLDSGSGALTFVASTDVGDKAWCVKFLVVPDEG